MFRAEIPAGYPTMMAMVQRQEHTNSYYAATASENTDYRQLGGAESADVRVMADAVTGTMEKFDLFAGLKPPGLPGTQWLGNQIIALGMLYYRMKDRL